MLHVDLDRETLSYYTFLLGHLIEDAIEDGKWKSLLLSRRSPPLSHLFFADDLMLFCKASLGQASVVCNVLETFYYFSGQKVNLLKSKVFFSPSTHLDVVN